jgi:hypothetical protein
MRLLGIVVLQIVRYAVENEGAVDFVDRASLARISQADLAA